MRIEGDLMEWAETEIIQKLVLLFNSMNKDLKTKFLYYYGNLL